MRTSNCPRCGNTVYFENVECVRCHSALAFDPGTMHVVASSAPSNQIRGSHHEPIAFGISGRQTYCSNATYGVCNWLTDRVDGNGLCRACDLNRTIPDLNIAGNLDAWNKFERAKKRLIYSFLRLGLPFDAASGAAKPLTFDFKDDAVTGHFDGLITVDVEEADAVERERQRQQFDEPFRTLLGHLRHESGHYFWDSLVAANPNHDSFRNIFGDERQNYTQALDDHYANGPDVNWAQQFVSAYASSHSWEDWAETWAHYLHMVDALETADTFWIEPGSKGVKFAAFWPRQAPDVYTDERFDRLMERWVALSVAMNSLNRSMGYGDYYPVVIPTPAYKKLEFVHMAIRNAARR